MGLPNADPFLLVAHHKHWFDPRDPLRGPFRAFGKATGLPYIDVEVESCVWKSTSELGCVDDVGHPKFDSTQAPPAADLSYPAGSAPACREVSLVLNLATNADGEEDPQPIFDYAATGACAAVDG